MKNALQYRSGISRIHRLATSIALAFLVSILLAPSAQAQTFTVLYTFTGGADGAHPFGGVIRDARGDLYGTTGYGGDSGVGTLFKLDRTGKETVLHSFGEDGGSPLADLIRDAAGNLYGTTIWGGLPNFGTVFKVTPSTTGGKHEVLHYFAGGADGAYPWAGLLRDASGNLYGVTGYGGAYDLGTVFKIDATGKYEVLHSFTGGTNGANPSGDLIRDAAGNLYGTTYEGGASNLGTVFKLDMTGKETVLHSFTGGADGARPAAGLIRDAASNLYGTTSEGGGSNLGTVFKLDTTGKETVLHSFTGGADGGYPTAGLIRDAAGNLYGATGHGGTYDLGTIYKVDKTGKETVLHCFTGGADGEYPVGALIRDAAGNLYGTAYLGGAFNYGTVFKLTPQ